MELTEQFLQNNNLQNPENIDSLLELATLLRNLIEEKNYPAIRRIITYTIEHSYGEAFSWCMGILQEELEKEDCKLESFESPIGRFIPNYDAFVEWLQVDFKTSRTELEKICDKHGEVESFFNIIVYKTGYENIHFVSAENFDTKDNDFVQYKLLFTKKKA